MVLSVLVGGREDVGALVGLREEAEDVIDHEEAELSIGGPGLVCDGSVGAKELLGKDRHVFMPSTVMCLPLFS